ncbi:metal ABC transporter permease [Jannaschia sp. LMIT008]|uniref:metal ABC transporter permease n=1 Tax=Jannaschia maritima TaxID=3032585 RepID=UPI0028121746|nr:iron chelate uptake ABC transporter family permease subunit [Jannaschia sp. LMIT008]
MTLLDDFLARAVLAGSGAALAAAPLGCMAIWRRMAFFSDATAHAALLGVALAIAVDVPVALGILAAALAMAVLTAALSERARSADTILAVLAHSGLAIGLLAVATLPGRSIDLHAFLFGDLLAVSRADVGVVWLGAAAVLAALAWRWQALLTTTLDPDLAAAAGYDPRRERLILSVTLAIVVAVAIKVVGALLIAALLVIPAAAARPFADTPERMVGIAALLGQAATLGGLTLSWRFDLPAGPAIVAVAAAAFALSALRR